MHILTFDIEEWFHILDVPGTKTEKEWAGYECRIHQNVDRILELLERSNQKATFFCLGWIARKYPEIVRKISESGYEIGCHSDMHQLVYEQTKEDFRKDLETSLHTIENITGSKIRIYRAPGFSITENTKWAFELLLKNGIEIDSSVFPAKRGHGGFENFGTAKPALISAGGAVLKEFPINLSEFLGKKFIFSGGGYFRLLPYWAICRAMKKSDYVMTYFHPRDFDSNQPMINEMPLARKFKCYYGLNGAFEKFEKLINDFSFTDLKEAEKNIDWDSVKVIAI